MFEFELKGLEMNKIGNSREGRPKCLNLNLKGWNEHHWEIRV